MESFVFQPDGMKKIGLMLSLNLSCEKANAVRPLR